MTALKIQYRTRQIESIIPKICSSQSIRKAINHQYDVFRALIEPDKNGPCLLQKNKFVYGQDAN